MRMLAVVLAALAGASATSARADGAFEWTDGGRIAQLTAESWDELSDFTQLAALAAQSSWASGHARRYELVLSGSTEAERALCGDEAHRAYDVQQGAAWCSEYVRTIYLGSGALDVACRVSLSDLFSSSCGSLSLARTVSALEGRFRANGGWTNAADLRPEQLQPGDYLAVQGSDGKPEGHSVLVLAISDDHRYIWTSEGNVNDCASFKRREFFTDGQLNPQINGAGNADKLFQ
jgi:hypothetical protein